MLDLSVIVAQMTQGQPAAQMTPLGTGPSAAGGGGESAGAPAGSAAPSASAPAAASASAAAPVDARIIADHVYELMRRDLLVQHERQGGR